MARGYTCMRRGGSSVVELLPSKQDVAGSNPVPRSKTLKCALFVAIVKRACAERGIPLSLKPNQKPPP